MVNSRKKVVINERTCFRRIIIYLYNSREKVEGMNAGITTKNNIKEINLVSNKEDNCNSLIEPKVIQAVIGRTYLEDI